MAKVQRANKVRLLGVVRRKRAALMMSTALQATVVLVLSQPANAQPAPNARPTGGSVVAGAAAISTTTSNTRIDQTSQRAAVNWNSFNVGSQQSVTFNQPSSSAVTLNRVTGPDPSQIAGRIDANGQLILINQSGVTFYKGAQVNANGLLVTASGISNQNFMAGAMTFDQPGKPNAKVDNQGNITIKDAGLAALVAPRVANSGTITARLGHVVLAGAKTATIDLYGDGMLSLDVTNQVTQTPVGPDGKAATALVTNSGVIIADGGTVQLTARAADGIVQNLVQAGGKIRAATMGDQTGTVALNGVGGSIVVEGQLSAPDYAPGMKGGNIEVATTGNVVVASTARINASGKAGGGNIGIGTSLDRVKGGPSVTPTMVAANTTISNGAKIRANATQQGDGGRVTALSAGTTMMDASISAQGGPQGGNGGFIETSGTGYLVVGPHASVTAAAPAGTVGQWLLDPDSDIDITNTPPGGFTQITTCLGGTCSPTFDSSYIDPATIIAALNGGTSVTVTTSNVEAGQSGNILVGVKSHGTDGQISGFNPATPVSLTLNSGAGGGAGSITFNSPVTDVGSGGTLSLLLNAGSSIAFGNTVTIGGSLNATAAINNPAGAIAVNSGGAISATAGVTLSAGTGGISLADNLTASGNTVTLNSAGTINQTAGVITAGTLTGSSVGGTSLTQGNLVTSLGTFADTGAGSTGIAFTDAQTFGTTGLVSSASGPVTLTTTGAGSNLTLGAGVSASGNTVTLDSAGTINQTAGVIKAGTLTGSSVGAATLLGATKTTNQIQAIGAFSSSSFVLRDGIDLAVNGAVTATSGKVFVERGGVGGTITIGAAGSLIAPAGKLVSIKSDNIAITAGASINGGTLEVAPDSPGAVVIGTPGGFLASLAGVNPAVTLVRIGAVTPPGGGAPVPTATSITTGGIFDATNHSLDLQTTGAIDGSAFALINVATLTGSSVGGTSLTQGNLVISLGTFTDTGAGSTGIAFTDAQTLGTTGLVSSASGPVTLTTTGVGSNLTLGAAVSTSGNTVTLNSAGTINQTAGVITAGTLTGSAVDAVGLMSNNRIAILSGFTAANFMLNDDVDLLISGTLNAAAIAVRAQANQISLGDGAAIVTGGSIRPPGAIQPALELLPGNGVAPGAYFQSAGFTQVGRSTVVGQGNGPTTLQIAVTGNIQFDSQHSLQAPGTWLILNLTGGTAVGEVFVNAFDVSYTTPGSADLHGAIQGINNGSAAKAGFIQPAVNANYLFNGCVIAAGCQPAPILPTPTPTPQITSLPDNALTSALGGLYQFQYLPGAPPLPVGLPKLVFLALPMLPASPRQLTDPDVVPPNISYLDY